MLQPTPIAGPSPTPSTTPSSRPRPQAPSKRLLIVDADDSRGPRLAEQLSVAGFAATLVSDARRLTDQEPSSFDLVLLDPSADETAAFETLARFRACSEVPVVVVSAVGETAAKVRALQLGADDYLTRPFVFEELVERVNARLRRPVLMRQTSVDVGLLRLDRAERHVYVDGALIDLTRVEFELLAVLAERPGAQVSRRVLADRVLDPTRDGDERTLDVHVSRIRKKLGRCGFVETVWGVGYRLVSRPPTT